MNKIEFSHFIKPIKTINDKTTVHFFDIFKLSLNEQYYDILSKNKNIFITESLNKIVPLNYKVADHIQFLNKNTIIQSKSLPKDRIRISMGVLVDICFNQKHLLLIEKNIIKPFGGSYEFYELPPIPSIILDNQKSKDLRFTINTQDLEEITAWFHLNKNRENSPLRELKEELTLENSILSDEEWNNLLK